MSTENKKKENNKIVPIRFSFDSSDDPEIDDFILKNLQEEADEIERKMNADPEFAKTAPPENQYEKIVARLKEMGEWEEDEEEGAEAEEEANEAAEGAAETGTETDAMPEDVYGMLSEEDRQALEIGRRERSRLGRKKARNAWLLRVTKRGGVVAAAFVLLFTVSMNVDASRRVILQMWDTVTDALVARTATDNLENSVESTMAASLAAMKEIQEATGIPGLEFMYWPAGMKYLQYELQDENAEAFVFYSYNDKILQMYMRSVNEDSTNSLITDQDIALEKTLTNWLGADVEIWLVDSDGEAEQYLAEFEYESYRYAIYGYISLEEMEEFVKGIDFVS